GPGDDLHGAVAVEVADGHEDPAGEGVVERLELADLGAVGGAEEPDQGEAPGAGGGDDDVLAVEQAGGDADAAGEGLEGVDLPQEGAGGGVVDVDQGQAAGAGADGEHAGPRRGVHGQGEGLHRVRQDAVAGGEGEGVGAGRAGQGPAAKRGRAVPVVVE